jgi:predicted RNA-binding Zn-ribbon protein involved in translation (DUF1610 family)
MPESFDPNSGEPEDAQQDGVEIGEVHKENSTQYECPNCKCTLIQRSFRFCPVCGLRLLWR